MNADDELKLRRWLDLGSGPESTAYSAETECEWAVAAATRTLDGDAAADVLSLMPLLLQRVRELERRQ